MMVMMMVAIIISIVIVLSTYIRDYEDGTNMFAPTLSLGNMELFGSELGILMMVIVMVMTMLAVEHHLFGVEMNIHQ